MSDLKSRLASLPPEKRAFILAQIKKKKEGLANKIQPLPRDGQPFPLTAAQERMWFLHKLEPTSPLYNIAIIFHIAGRLDARLLEQSFTILINQHEALRTTFEMIDEQPMQLIHEQAPLAFSLIDLSFEQNAEERFYQLANTEIRSPFDLQKLPLMRVVLFKIDHHNYRLVITMHHTISDGWSLGLLAQNLAQVYTDLKEQNSHQQDPPSIQSADFAVWQRQWLQGENLDDLLQYWQKHLENVPQTLELPTDPPEEQSDDVLTGHRLPFELDETLYKEIKQLAQDHNVTLFMVLFAAFAVALSRLSGQKDFVIGTPIVNRNQSELMSVIGVFVNTLALRVKISNDASFLELLEQVKQTVLDGMQHQALPFAKLVDNLHLERFLNQSPLFQVSFSLQENPLQSIEMPNVEVTLLEIKEIEEKNELPPIHTGVSMFDITMHLSEIDDKGVGGWIEYRHNSFKSSAIKRFGEQYQTLLKNIIASPEQKISQLPLLTVTERQLLLHDWNGVNTPLPDLRCLHDLVTHLTEPFADNIAIEEIKLDGQKYKCTYAELHQRTNQLAHYLQKIGVKPETMVGICIHRSLDMIVAMLAVLKAGGAFMPLAPEYPQHRLQYMVDDAEMMVLLTQSALHERITEYTGRKICLDTDWDEIAEFPSTPVTSAVLPANIAYMIYTSGSTGNPKGTMITHISICNLMLAQIKAFGLNADSRVLQFASSSFDAAISEIFTTLGAGATLLVTDSDRLMPSEEFVHLINNEQISVITLPPSVLQALSDYQFTTVKTLISAGEMCSWKIATRFAQNRRFLNFYGPTEATIGSSYYELEGVLAHVPNVPIGQAIDNLKLYVVDEYLQLVPIGVPGELMIGQIALARGYWQRSQLTAEKFIPDPFSNIPGSRLYRTGDLVRYWSNGQIEFLGRIDSQVKLRGYRIELGEIENVLKDHHTIREAAVILRYDVASTPQLVAYFIPEEGEEMAELVILRHHLTARLPDYMIPAIFVPVEAWPLTSNNKIDRKALPRPANRHLKPKRQYAAARNTVEETLTRIWQSLFQQKEIGIYDNFFELGGDSIMSIQMVSRARQKDLYLTPKHIFQHQTIAELATLANTQPQVETEQGVVMGAVPLTPIQQWFFNNEFPNVHYWNQAVMAMGPAHLNLAWLQQTLVTLLTHHDALRLRFHLDDGEWHQLNTLPQESSIITIVTLDHMSPTEQKAEVTKFINLAHNKLNLTDGPLFRVIYFDFGSYTPASLFFVAHHLIIDAVSWRIIFEDFITAYTQLSQNKVVQLPAKTSSYQQWSKHIEQYAKQQDPESYFAYWLSLPDKMPLLPISPTGEEPLIEANKNSVTTKLDIEQTALLLQDVHHVYNTNINDLLLSALALAVNQWTGESSVWVDLESYGRQDLFSQIDLSRTVGWFTVLYPTYLELPTNEDDSETVIKTIKEQIRQIPNQGFNYSLHYYWEDDPAIAKLLNLPKPQISFNYLGQLDTTESNDLLTLDPHADLGLLRDKQTPRLHLLEIEVQIVNQQLEVKCYYSPEIMSKDECQTLIHQYRDHLSKLINHCLNPNAGGYTPSDFPEANLTMDALDSIFSELEL